MPKDPTRNVDRYKVRGGQFDDLDRTKNDGVQTGDAPPLTGSTEESNFIPGETPQEEAERKRRLIEEVHAKAEQRRQKEGKGVKKPARAGGGKRGTKKSAKKSAKKSTKKAAKKASKAVARGAKKASKASKDAGKKGRGASGAKKSASKKGAAKKSGAKSTKGRAGRPGAG